MSCTHRCQGGVAVTREPAASARAVLGAAAAQGIRFQGPAGIGEPEVTATRIAVSDDPGDGGPLLEFTLGAGDRLKVVKTRRLPRDEAVTAVPVAARARAASSDGSFSDGVPRIALRAQACGPVPPAGLALLRRPLDREDG